MAIVQALRAMKEAVLAFHRWFMKYSGMTMIIDNVEERRRGRPNDDGPGEDSGSSCERDSRTQKQELETLTRTAADKDLSVGSTGAALGSTEGNKKVLG